MNNPYLNEKDGKERLLKDALSHDGKLIIAFDFDSTVASYPDMEPYEDVINLLKDAKEQGHTLILFTSNEGEKLWKRQDRCDEWGITPDYVNESPVLSKNKKPYYNILLDDRAGLPTAFDQLAWVLHELKKNNYENH